MKNKIDLIIFLNIYKLKQIITSNKIIKKKKSAHVNISIPFL